MELGETTLTLALVLSVYALAAHIISIWKKKNELFDSARITIIGIAVLATIASIWLFNLFITRNFQYEYVAIYSARRLRCWSPGRSLHSAVQRRYLPCCSWSSHTSIHACPGHIVPATLQPDAYRASRDSASCFLQ